MDLSEDTIALVVRHAPSSSDAIATAAYVPLPFIAGPLYFWNRVSMLAARSLPVCFLCYTLRFVVLDTRPCTICPTRSSPVVIV